MRVAASGVLDSESGHGRPLAVVHIESSREDRLVADRTFAADGDPTAAGPGGPGVSFDADTRRVVDDADALAGVTRRLQTRLDRQLWLLGRMQGDPLQPEPAQLPELIDIAHRMRRDSESMLLLGGRDPGVRHDAPQGLAGLLAAAAEAAEEPRRVEVRPAPPAAVVPGAATELVHVLAELLDHTTAVYPGASVQVGSHVSSSGSVAVEVRALGADRHDLDALGGQRALDAAERLAGRSRHGIALQRELGGDDLVATITCPRAAVVVEDLGRPVPTSRNGHGSNGRSPRPYAAGLPIEELPARPLTVSSLSGPATELDPVSTADGLDPGRFDPPGLDSPGFDSPGFDPSALPELEPAFAAAPERSRSGSTNGVPTGGSPGVKVDELFGPISAIPVDPDGDPTSTPIFEAIASAWFRDGAAANASTANGTTTTTAEPALDWETPGDREWRAAADKATRTEPTKLTAKGLPVRRPGNQLVPPPRSRSEATEKPAEKVAPEHVRDRLAGYQRGVERGRHRADPGAGAEPGDPEFW